MFYLYCILLLIIILLVIPIPIKFSFKYTKNTFNIYIYNFKINLKKSMNFLKEKGKKTTATFKEEDHKLDLSSVFALINYIDTIKYKPTLRFRLYCNYGLIDASKTAITYGYIYALSPLIYKSLNIPFKIKKYDYDIEPNFEGTFLESNIDSIIFVNIIKIIYMFIVIRTKIKYLKNIKSNT
jgi:hypothetical protein